MIRAARAWLFAALHACSAPPPASPVDLDPAPPTPSAAPESPPPPDVSAVPSAPASAAPAEPPAPPSLPLRFSLEPAYLAGAPPLAPPGPARQEQLRELERWNQGGLGDDEKWHPAPRVVIEEPVLSKGKGATRALLQKLRAEHYWTARRCYDPRLRERADLAGRVVIRITQDVRGVVTRASARGGKGVPDRRKHKSALQDAAVGACIAQRLVGASLPLPRKGGATSSFSVDLYPGDAPLPEPDTRMSPGRIDLGAVDRVAGLLAPSLSACFSEASERRPGLWGRLALRLAISPEGRVTEAQEVDSTFPDPGVVRCARARLESAVFPGASGEGALVVLPARWAPVDPG